MSETITAQTILEVTSCADCGVEFAVPQRILKDRRQKKGDFFCPNGHSLTYGDTELDKLRRQNQSLTARLTAEVDQHQAALRSNTALKGEITKQKKRGAASLCPVPGCHRSFVQVRKHIANKHPDYVETA